MAAKDLPHLRLCTSNVMPSRIQVQFCEAEFWLLSNAGCRDKGFQFWAGFLERALNPWVALLSPKNYSECNWKAPFLFSNKQASCRKKHSSSCFLIPLQTIYSLCRALSLNKLNSLSQKYPVEGLASDGSYLQRQATSMQSWQCPNTNNWPEHAPFLRGFLNLTCKKARD